ncbi:hypothetical protein MJO10_31970, partial [Salmonella enterica subsp. enterica serovar Anatum]|nr:hypothetical protein [Salmonella enterica subsp. enterica serovar Anatum]
MARIAHHSACEMDRVNIGFAALRMNESLGITPEDFANISSIFFISYLIFQIPS